MKNKIKAIIFDFGGVIGIGNGWKDVAKRYGEHLNLPEDKLYLPLIKGYNRLKTSRITEEEFWSGVSKDTGVKIDGKLRKKLEKLITSYGSVDTDMLSFIKKLKKDYPIYLLTNHVKFWFEKTRSEYKLDNLFDSILTSYNLKQKKPDKSIYSTVLKMIKLKPQDCIFIDDQEKNVESAKKAGINAICYKGIENLKEELAGYGVLKNKR